MWSRDCAGRGYQTRKYMDLLVDWFAFFFLFSSNVWIISFFFIYFPLTFTTWVMVTEFLRTMLVPFLSDDMWGWRKFLSIAMGWWPVITIKLSRTHFVIKFSTNHKSERFYLLWNMLFPLQDQPTLPWIIVVWLFNIAKNVLVSDLKFWANGELVLRDF